MRQPPDLRAADIGLDAVVAVSVILVRPAQANILRVALVRSVTVSPLTGTRISRRCRRIATPPGSNVAHANDHGGWENDRKQLDRAQQCSALNTFDRFHPVPGRSMAAALNANQRR